MVKNLPPELSSKFFCLEITLTGHNDPGFSMTVPFGPGSPTIDLCPPEQRRFRPVNLGGFVLCQYGTGT